MARTGVALIKNHVSVCLMTITKKIANERATISAVTVKLIAVSFLTRYGDKAPKSTLARIFSVFWILLGLVIMAVFMANITSALTALSLQLEPTDLVGLKVCINICCSYNQFKKDRTRVSRNLGYVYLSI